MTDPRSRALEAKLPCGMPEEVEVLKEDSSATGKKQSRGMMSLTMYTNVSCRRFIDVTLEHNRV